MEIEPAAFFHLLSDETRLRSLVLMQQEGELCVCELMAALGEIQPKVSRHLAALRDAGVVLDERRSQWVYYRINPELPGWAAAAIAATVDENSKRPPFSSDREALAGMQGRPSLACSA